MTDSTMAGYLAPLDAGQPEDLDLDGIIQPAIVGITGLADPYVIIKGQPIPPQQPDRPITWCAVGVGTVEFDPYPSLVHDGDAACGQGQTVAFRTEYLEIMASFYGPSCRSAAARLRDGFGIGQNRDMLRAQGLAFVSVERMTFVPDLQNQQFIRRVDLVMRLRRMPARVYAIRNVESLTGTVTVDAQSKTGPATLVDTLQTGT